MTLDLEHLNECLNQYPACMATCHENEKEAIRRLTIVADCIGYARLAELSSQLFSCYLDPGVLPDFKARYDESRALIAQAFSG